MRSLKGPDCDPGAADGRTAGSQQSSAVGRQPILRANSPPKWLPLSASAVCAALALLLSGCTVKEGEARRDLIRINGSSTVEPITTAVAEAFKKRRPEINPLVGTSGTGGGFKKFCLGETDINDASRPITEEESEECRSHGIDYIELKVAIDGLSVVVHPENDWCDCLSVEQLEQIWRPDNPARKWSDLQEGWPQEEITLYGPDTESGTFDYFTEVICGQEGKSRSDYTASTDDNVLVRGVASDKYSLGYFGYAYAKGAAERGQLKILAVKPPDGQCIKPDPQTIESGQYRPLARPLYLYVNTAALKRPEVVEFLQFYLNEGQDLVSEVGYVRLSETAIQESRRTLQQAVAGANP